MSTFIKPPDLEQITLAKSSDINAITAATKAAFDLLPDENDLKTGAINYAQTSGGVANAYVVTMKDAALNFYQDGMQVIFKPVATNTSSTVSIIVNGLGSKSIILPTGQPISANDISVNAPVSLRYSSTIVTGGAFVIDPNSSNYATIATTQAGIATTQAANAATSATNAASSATSAASSATTATTQATNAAASATSASTSATTATTQATNAAASATSAASSATTATTKANEAAASATSAANYATALTATSTTSTLIGTGAKTFTTQANKQFQAGQTLKIVSQANSANFMIGTVTSYSTISLAMAINSIGGSGTFSDWNISITGERGTTGLTGGVSLGASTDITGLVKGGSGVLSAAVPGTDYPPINNPTFTGDISDPRGDIRKLSVISKTTGFSLALTENKYVVSAESTCTAITVPNALFSIGDNVTIINNKDTAITLTIGSGLVAYISGITTAKTTITVEPRGICSLLFLSSSLVYVNGLVS